jgi:hypothetical protein
MLNTNIILREIAHDIISVVIIWGLINNSNINLTINNKTYPIYTNLIGSCISLYILRKYI